MYNYESEFENLILVLANKQVIINVLNGQLVINAPKNTLDDVLINRIKIHKANLIAYLSGQSLVTKTNNIKIAEQNENYPLSSSQYRLWALSQVKENSVTFNLTGTYEFEGDLVYDSFLYAFEVLTERHEILRTVFREDSSVISGNLCWKRRLQDWQCLILISVRKQIRLYRPTS